MILLADIPVVCQPWTNVCLWRSKGLKADNQLKWPSQYDSSVPLLSDCSNMVVRTALAGTALSGHQLCWPQLQEQGCCTV